MGATNDTQSASDATPAFGPVWRNARQWRLWLAGLVGARFDGLHHFAVVEPGVLMRCGQPHVRDLEKIRGEHGLATVVAARGGTRHPLRGRWFRKQRGWCERNGVRLVHMPLADFREAPRAAFDAFVELVRDEGARPVLVHCEQGIHRTGVLVAAMRIALQQWPLDEALKEMAHGGFDPQDPKRQSLIAALRDWATADTAS